MNKIQFPTADGVKTLLRRWWLPALLVGVVIIIFLIWKVPQWQAQGITDPKDHAIIENAARVTLVQAFGGLFVIITACFTGLNFTVAQENLIATQEKLVTDRFAKAIELLGNGTIEVRLGAIYALERISKDSDRDYWQVMEILTAYIRERCPYPPIGQAHDQDPSSMATDIQAVLTVIIRRVKSYGQGGEENNLNLSKSNLFGANLGGANLGGANLCVANLFRAQLYKANLSGAQLYKANLSGAQLYKANLSGAQLYKANLSEAILFEANLFRTDLFGANLCRAKLGGANLSELNLYEANLREADLFGVNLFGANLGRANLFGVNLFGANLGGANLFGANLFGVNLGGANLSGADLSGADLSEANLSEADFSGAKNLSLEQVKSAQNWEKAIYDEEFRKLLGLGPEQAK